MSRRPINSVSAHISATVGIGSDCAVGASGTPHRVASERLFSNPKLRYLLEKFNLVIEPPSKTVLPQVVSWISGYRLRLCASKHCRRKLTGTHNIQELNPTQIADAHALARQCTETSIAACLRQAGAAGSVAAVGRGSFYQFGA
jgi:hypothetical protein